MIWCCNRLILKCICVLITLLAASTNTLELYCAMSDYVFIKRISVRLCRFFVVIRFFIPATTANDFEGFSITDFIHYIYFPILILEKVPVFPFLMFSAKQGHYWYHFYNVFGMTRSLTGD